MTHPLVGLDRIARTRGNIVSRWRVIDGKWKKIAGHLDAIVGNLSDIVGYMSVVHRTYRSNFDY